MRNALEQIGRALDYAEETRDELNSARTSGASESRMERAFELHFAPSGRPDTIPAA